MKKQALSSFDRAVFNISSEFSKIPNYEKVLEDEDLKKLHTFVAVGIMSIHDAITIVYGSFIPAANKLVVNTRDNIQKSLFKNVFTSVNYDPVIIQHDTIRLGYVFVFHKFEVFVNQLIDMLDDLSGKKAVTVREYAISKFRFNVKHWYKNKAIHLVNFISNCTKHQDGFCRSDNASHTIPEELNQVPENHKIIRTAQQFKSDTNALTDQITSLIRIISLIMTYQTAENSLKNLSESPIFEPSDDLIKSSLLILENSIRNLIRYYEQ
ncbi:hypothetical protein [Mucilaginibacter ginkgonis]|uniref:Uncharacterized protein n=1 Tax=Mucilaginibacter ginkgonis TaxID=2682091 RepID=A0A6I4IMN2_9SPHI|nr:hypothetical protein [Mucilaginibacter ginkgonis]QQL50009.1 hypothetical protein GO620_000735 [Mucilaginibacter ginkgonis]